MNEEMSAPDLLRAAARLIDKALAKLNLKEEPCDHCGTRLFENREHGKIHQQFAATPEKLRTAAKEMGRRETPEPAHQHVSER